MLYKLSPSQLIVFPLYLINFEVTFAQDALPATSPAGPYIEIFIITAAALGIVAFLSRYFRSRTDGVIQGSAVDLSSQRNSTNLGVPRGVLLSLLGAAIGLGVGYVTMPYDQGRVFLTTAQANRALQETGIHIMISVAVGLAVGIVLHILVPNSKR